VILASFIIIMAAASVYVYSIGGFGGLYSILNTATWADITDTCTGERLTTQYPYEYWPSVQMWDGPMLHTIWDDTNPLKDGTVRLYPSEVDGIIMICNAPKWFYQDGTTHLGWVDLAGDIPNDRYTGAILVNNPDSYCVNIQNSYIVANQGQVLPYTLIHPCDSPPPPPPTETCYDGIKNQNEIGVDCGGVCPDCDVPPPPPDEFPYIVIVVIAGIGVMMLVARKYL